MSESEREKWSQQNYQVDPQVSPWIGPNSCLGLPDSPQRPFLTFLHDLTHWDRWNDAMRRTILLETLQQLLTRFTNVVGFVLSLTLENPYIMLSENSLFLVPPLKSDKWILPNFLHLKVINICEYWSVCFPSE